MAKFWDNINKFPKFILSVIIGFFLTTFHEIFELFKKRNKREIIIITIITLISVITLILRQMMGIN
uniref:Uncharacterized protein ycf33 n=1 Tax=Hydropuntia rangiferina TaxID=338881 RepID=A0A345U8L4_9FLOR|nr:hypothetical protein [Hydropuntia rangiferina]AXI96800.1 hypothetical protein [Hydropuntia rangiferina]UAD87481.1 hypothetical protein [Hydropuntia rangiferina]